MQNFFELLYSNVPLGQGMDQICWRPSREGKFDVHSYYDVLRGLRGGGGGGGCFPWRIIWCTESQERLPSSFRR